MSAPSPTDAANASRGCGGNCSVCGGRGLPDAPPGSPCGSRLAISAALVFVLPLACAAFGATRAGADVPHQALGALAGFAVGVVSAQAAVFVLRRVWRTAS